MQKRFADRVVIVTGASSGLGLATARAFANEGAKVVLAARNAERLHQAATELEKLGCKNVLDITCDVSKREDVDQLVSKTIVGFGRIDILVNNAGFGLIAPIEQINLKDAIALFETDFFGAFSCVQAVLPYMKRQSSGHIINMASVAGLRGIPNSSMYSAAKAALIAFSDALRIEVKESGITVSTICPSRTRDTPFVENAIKYGPVELYRIPEKLTTDMVVCALLNAVITRKRTVILPFNARLMHTVNKFFPRLVDYFLYKRMPKLEITDTER